MTDHVVIFITASSRDEAEQICRALVEERLIACGNLIYPIRSIFRWKEEVCREEEVLLIAKSRQELLHRIVRRVRQLHSYEVPEVIALPIVGGSPAYLQWVDEEADGTGSEKRGGDEGERE